MGTEEGQGRDPILCGRAGKALHEDLARGSLEVEEPSREFFRCRLGEGREGVAEPGD
jgi:hypothetical protein